MKTPNPVAIGDVFSELTVIEALGRDKWSHLLFRCLCSCGVETLVTGSKLRFGRIKRCGAGIHFAKHHQTKGKNRAPEYTLWINMKERCLNIFCKNFHNYGGRGIGIYAPWITDFDMFFNYMGKRPTKRHSIDRINNSGNYEPGNVRWAVWETQANNRRSNSFVEIEGEKMTVAQASRKYNICYSTIDGRKRRGLQGSDLVN